VNNLLSIVDHHSPLDSVTLTDQISFVPSRHQLGRSKGKYSRKSWLIPRPQMPRRSIWNSRRPVTFLPLPGFWIAIIWLENSRQWVCII